MLLLPSNLMNKPKILHIALTEEVSLTIFNDALLEHTRTAFKCDKRSVSDIAITSKLLLAAAQKELGMLHLLRIQ